MYNISHVCKHGWLVMHLVSSFISICGAKFMHVVGFDSTQSFSCVVYLFVTTSGKIQAAQECDDKYQYASFFWKWPFVLGSQFLSQIGFLFVWHIGTVWQLCAKQSFSFSSPGHWRRQTLFRVNLRQISPLLICSNYYCATYLVFLIKESQQYFIRL